ncbi:conserved protein, unknown function [Babesia microti strain RI]|uniref:Uncharacterized protein n=1 Tax=Babesia microti (strain RI) TaxID=1133968 RepID=A0A1R4ABP2_BABMR|nr:conserved protein, unknown function [Babesia microti strain RI]SJK86408.1 conserved protein, unknown function [Babesia microti strain RI]|eukprot:XP_021338569.1 conserved protein, unknown function [Babesia microti strain RI]
MVMSIDEPLWNININSNNDEFDIEEMAFGLPPINDEAKQIVDRLIKEEMELILQESSQNNLNNLLKGYLQQFDANNQLLTNTNYQSSLASKHEKDVAQNVTLEKLDFNRYSNFPVDEAKTEADVNGVTDQLRVVMEYANSAVINAELMDKFKQESWQKYIESFQGYKQRLEKEVEKAQRELEELNKRKRERTNHANSMTSPLIEKRDELFNKNVALLAELKKLSSNSSIKM